MPSSSDLTPELDRLAEEGIFFERLYATGMRSVRGIEAILTCITPRPQFSVVKTSDTQQDFFTLASLLESHGYENSFIYGGESHFDHMREFFLANGFQKVIDENDYEDPVFRGPWGVSDEDLFRKAHAEFEDAGDKPFFSLVFTSSTHRSRFRQTGSRRASTAPARRQSSTRTTRSVSFSTWRGNRATGTTRSFS